MSARISDLPSNPGLLPAALIEIEQTGTSYRATVQEALDLIVIANVGAGATIFRDETPANTYNFKSIIGGTNVTVDNNADNITINSSAAAGLTSINADTTAAQIIAGTAGRISIADVGPTHTIDIDGAYVGQASITTLGTITTGVWNATGIAYAFLNLTGGIVNADINAAAAIDYSKLNLTGSITNADLAGLIQFSKLENLVSGNILVGSVGNIATSVAVTGDVLISNTGVTSINTGVIVDADVNASAAIQHSKLESIVVATDQTNIYTAGARQDFLGLLAGTAGLNVGGIAGNPTTQVDGDIWLNTSTNQILGRINGVDVDLGVQGGAEFLGPWTADHDAGGFDLLNVGGITINNPADTFQYVITPAAITLDRIVNLPLLTGTDTIVFESHAATLLNKTLTSPILTTPQINDTTLTNQYIFAVSELAANRTVTLPLLAGNDEFTFNSHAATLSNKTLGSTNILNGVQVSSNGLAYDDGIKQTFNPNSTDAGINVGSHTAEPSVPINGDIFYDSTANQLKGYINGVWENLSTNAAQTPWTSDIDADGFDLTDLSNLEFRTTTGAPGATSRAIWFDINGMKQNIPTADSYQWNINGTNEMSLTATALDLQSNNITSAGTINTHTIPGGTSTFAIQSDNLSVFAATTSAQLAGVISDETGTGLLVFGTSPQLTTPQINDTSSDHQYIFAVSELTLDRTVTLPLLTGNDTFVFEAHTATLTNKTVNLANNTLTGTKAEFNTAVSDDTAFAYVGTSNAWADGVKQTFNPNATNAGLNVGAHTGEPSAPADGDIFYDSTANALKARINAAWVSLGAGGGSQTPWTSDIDADGFDLNDLSNILFRTTTLAPGATDRSIWYDDAEGMGFNALTGDHFRWEINAVLEMQLTATELNLQNNNLNIGTGTAIWNAGQTIIGDAGGLTIEVPTGDGLDVTINGTSTFEVTSAGNIVAGAKAQLATTATDGFLYISESNGPPTGVPTVITGKLPIHIDSLNSDLYIYDGGWVNISPAGGSDTPWTEDHDADGFDLRDLSNLEFRDTTGAPIATIPAIWNDATGMKFNEPTGDNFIWSVNGVTEVTLDAAALTLAAGNNLIMGAATLDGYIELGELTGNAATPAANKGRIFLKLVTDHSEPFYVDELGTVTNMITGGGSQTPWTQNIDADGFDLQDLSNIEFRTSTGAPGPTIQAIYADADGIILNVPTGDDFTISINDVDEYIFGASTFNINGNTITNTGVLTLPTATGTILSTGQAWTMGDGIKATFNPNATNAGLNVGGHTADPSALSDGDIWLNTTSNTLFARINGANVNLGQSGAQTPWISDVDADGFDLTDLSNIVFRTTTGAPIATDRSIHYDDTTGMEFNALTGDNFLFQVNNVTEMTLSATSLDISSNNLITTGFISVGASPADAGTIRLPNAATIEFEAAPVGANGVLSFNASEVFTLSHSLALAATTRLFLDGGTDNFIEETAADDALWSIGGENAIRLQEIGTEINVVLGANNALATTATDGFLYIPSMAGVPTGNSTDYTGKFPIVYDSTGQNLYLNTTGTTWINLSAGGGSQTPWTSNIDADGFDLEDISNIEFRQPQGTTPANTIVWIGADNGNLYFHVPTGDAFTYRINGTQEYRYTATEANFSGNNITSVGSLTLTGQINMASSQQIVWGGDANRRIWNGGTGFEFEVSTGDTFNYEINSILEYSFGAAQADFNGNNLIDVGNVTLTAGGTLSIVGTGAAGFIDIDEITTPANPAANTGRLYVKDLSTVTTLYFRDSAGTETNLLAGGSSPPFVDTNSIVEGSADATKELRFEVDGNTTGIVGVIATAFTTAKTVTIPDATDTLMGKATTDVMTNKSLDADGTGNVITNIGSSEIKSEMITGFATVTAVSGDFVLISDTSDAGNLKKANASDFLGGASPPFDDGTALVQGSADATKLLRFEVDGQTTAITGVIATSFTTAKTITIPDATDTLVGKATTDVFTNKSIDANGTGNVITNIGDAEIETHTTTKITTSNKSLLNSAIVYNDQANTFGDFIQTFKDNAIHIENPAGTFDVVIQTSAETVSDRILTIPLLGGNRTIVVTGLSSQITLGTEVTGASTNLTDTADIAYLNTDNTFLTNTRHTFTHQASKAGIALAAVAGDVTAPNNGEFWYNSTTNKFRARENGSTVDMIGGGGEVFTWTADHSTGGNKLTTAAATDLILNGVTGQNVQIEINAVDEYTFDASKFAVFGNAIDLSIAGDNAERIISDVDSTVSIYTVGTEKIRIGVGFMFLFGIGLDMEGNDIRDAQNVRMDSDETHQLDFRRDTPQADNYVIGEMRFLHDDQSGIIENYARITGTMVTDAVAANEEGSLQIYVTENGVHDTLVMEFNAAGGNDIDILKELNMNGQKITDIGETTITDLSTVTAATGDFIWIIDATDGLNKKVNASDFLGGGEVFTWTANHDANGFALEAPLFADPTVTTKQVAMTIDGATASTTTTLDFNQTVNRTITFPDITGTVMLNVVEDTTPQAGGNFDIQGFNIISTGSQTSDRINLPNGSTNGIGFENNAGTDNIAFYLSGTDVLTVQDSLYINKQASGAASISVDAEDNSASITASGYSNIGQMVVRRANTSRTSPSQVTNGQVIGRVSYQGYHSGGAFSGSVVRLDAVSSENFTATNQGAECRFYTTPLASTTATLALTLEADGTLTMENTGIGISFGPDGHSIIPSATALTYNTGAAGDDHIFQSLGVTDFRISGTGSAFMLEKAAADADVANFGQLWVLNTIPNALMFTDDTGVDSNLTRGVHDIPTTAASWFAPTLEPATGLTNINFPTNDHDYKVWEFTSTTVDERIQFNTTLPRNIDLSDIDVIIKWSFASGTGVVRWGIRSVGMGDNDALDSAWGTPVEANDTAGTANQVQEVTLSALAVGGTPGEGDEIAFEVYREGSDAGDTFSGTARLHSVIFRVRKTRGSAAT